MSNESTVKFKEKGLKEVFEQLKRLSKAGTDLTPMWLEFLQDFKSWESENWQYTGKPFGVRWKPLTPKYAKWKRSIGKGWKANLILTGDLKKAASGGNGWFQEIQKNKIRFGIDKAVIPYALAHQYGYKKNNLPARPYFANPDGSMPGLLLQRLKNIAIKYVNKAKDGK